MAAGTPEKAIDEAKTGMEKALHSLRHDLQRVRTGRANAQLLDGVLGWKVVSVDGVVE